MTTTLLLGGRIHSSTAPDATAMAIEDGVIVWLGQDPVGQARYAGAGEAVALDGAFVAPAFVDAHVHSTSAGLLRTGLDLTGCGSLSDCLDAVRSRVRALPGAPIWGHGWDETNWPERRPPTRAELGEASGAALVYLSRIDVHSALVSPSLADRVPEARSADGWSDSGPLARDAHHHVRKAALESITPAQRREAQLAFLRRAAAMGVAAVHECAGPVISSADDFAELLAVSGEHGPEVVGYWGERGAPDRALPPGATGLAGDLFVDGALGSRTAALCSPYADEPGSSGALYLDVEQVAAHVVACTQAGVQAGFHVIGDAAVGTVVDGFAVAEKFVGRQALAGARHRLEHLEMVTAEQAERLAGWGVVASVQPLFDAAWGGRDGMYARRLGPARGSALNPFAQLAAAGVVLAFGSDVPVTPVDPWAAVRAAVHHRSDGFGISPAAAFAAHTRGGWWAAGVADQRAGTLAPGAPATYAVWDAGELVDGLPSVEPGVDLPVCMRTVLNGKTIYEVP